MGAQHRERPFHTRPPRLFHLHRLHRIRLPLLQTHLPAMKHTHPLLGAAALGALLLALSGCEWKQRDEQQPAAAAALQSPDSLCANGDLGKRSKLYNESTLKNAVDTFNVHFKAWVDGSNKDITGTSVPLLVDKLKDLRDNMNPKPVALMVHYGLHEDRFAPVFQFMELSADGVYAVPVGDLYVAVNGELVLPGIAGPSAQDLMDNYASSIRIRRTIDPAWTSAILAPSDFPDPLGEWFRFPLELDRLVAENNGDDMALVLTCISEPVCYSAALGFVPGQGEEYRHLIAWHVAHGNQPQLSEDDLDAPQPDGKLYLRRAVDLGHLCPPRCR